MKIMKGKYNTANIMIDEIDETTRNQIQEFLNHPAFANTYIAIMPDCHAGKGAVVGFTMRANKYVIPNIIGVDIGCGMLMAKFPISKLDLPGLDAAINHHIPSGFSINSNIPTKILEQKRLVLKIKDVCEKIGIDSEKALKAIGSLGGGNHFIEAGVDQNHNFIITVHSGSRNFGKCVADFYQKKAKEGLAQYFIHNMYKDLEFIPKNTDDGSDYLYCMRTAQEFAHENRKEIMERISAFIGTQPEEIIESVHNFIGQDQIVRKGATSARLGEKVIIPFNMADGIALCIGKGSAKYNYSAPHGAGRILSRNQAKKSLNIDEFKSQMTSAGVYSTSVCAETLDESPMAYKSMDAILENIKDTVDVIEIIRPVYNFKGYIVVKSKNRKIQDAIVTPDQKGER